MSMSIRRTRHRGPASTGRNRVYRSPNGLIPEFLWSKHRLNKIKRVQTNIARSNQEVGDLITGDVSVLVPTDIVGTHQNWRFVFGIAPPGGTVDVSHSSGSNSTQSLAACIPIT